jgi:N-acetylmuramoyl-L-alanine amidase
MRIEYPVLKYAKPLIPLNLDKVKYITLHHIEALSATPQDIHKWHLENGWSGAGYNEYIRKDGTVYILRGDYIGAHSHNNNSTSYGIACEGNYDKELTMPRLQLESLVARIQYNRPRFPNYEYTIPHREKNATQCPGQHFPIQEVLLRLMPTEHWAEDIYSALTKDFGLVIHEKRFDDNITRGEQMAITLQALKSMKNYIDQQ